MNGDQKFWIRIWSIILVGFVTLVTGVTIHNVNLTNVIERMVKGGADPMMARCAIDSVSTSALCIAYVTKR